jgi:hypothetical protein
MKDRASVGVWKTMLGMAAIVGSLSCAGCAELWTLLASGEEALVQITLVNESETQTVAPNLGVCPNGMASEPHYFVDSPPVIAPGEEVTYTTGQIAGLGGNCLFFSTDFMIGLCGWQYGPSADELTSVDTQYGGQIGFQFSCGDTVIMRWSDTGENGGAWTTEVQPGAGNDAPVAEFQEL